MVEKAYNSVLNHTPIHFAKIFNMIYYFTDLDQRRIESQEIFSP